MNKVNTPESLASALENFDVTLLEDVPEGAQMERIDRKYAFPVHRIPDVLENLENRYTIVIAAGERTSPYSSTYLDTPDFLCFQNHQRGFLNRDKIRYRSYPNTGTTFLEIKHKSNKGQTLKDRILVDGQPSEMDLKSRRFLSESIVKINPDNLIVSATVYYQRIQFISKIQDERFSIDFNIHARYHGKNADFGPVAILEVKQDFRFTSPIVHRMRELRYFEVSMSKYCLALTMLEPNLKSNRFKEDLRRLRKINNQQTHAV